MCVWISHNYSICFYHFKKWFFFWTNRSDDDKFNEFCLSLCTHFHGGFDQFLKTLLCFTLDRNQKAKIAVRLILDCQRIFCMCVSTWNCAFFNLISKPASNPNAKEAKHEKEFLLPVCLLCTRNKKKWFFWNFFKFKTNLEIYLYRRQVTNALVAV